MGFLQNRRFLKISVALILVMVLCFVIYHALDIREARNVMRRSFYSVVLDCGSSGTRVNVYEFMMNGGRGLDLPVLVHTYPDYSHEVPPFKTRCEYHCMQTEPGLDKFVGDLSGVKASIKPLIVRAEQWVPLDRHGDTPIFVLATAGLRKLPTMDTQKVLKDAEAVVMEHSFMHTKGWIRVLSGEEEAYYGWVALNYKMGILGNSSRSPTLGLLDLGGSSLQVVMEVDESRDNSHIMRSKVGPHEHNIVTYSFQHLGLNEAFDKTFVTLSQSRPLRAHGRLQVNHPCLYSGFTQKCTCRECFRMNSSICEDTNSQFSESDLVDIVGDPNWEQCQTLAMAVITNSSSDWSSLTGHVPVKSSESSCIGSTSLDIYPISNSVLRFHALSGFFVVYNTLNLSPRADLTKIWGRGQYICSISWPEFLRISGNRSHAEQHCFRVAYIMSLIEDTLCLGNKEIAFGPADVSWPLGAALVEGKYIFSASSGVWSNISVPKPTWLIYSPVYLFILLLCLLLIVYYSQLKLPMLHRSIGSGGANLPSYIYPKQRPSKN